MKKLAFLIVLLIITSCGASYEKEATSDVSYDSYEEEMVYEVEENATEFVVEPHVILEETLLVEEEPILLEITKLEEPVFNVEDTVVEDTLEKKSNKREKLQISKIDTTSVLNDIKKNRQTLDDQHQLLDSLLKKKGK